MARHTKILAVLAGKRGYRRPERIQAVVRARMEREPSASRSARERYEREHLGLLAGGLDGGDVV